MKLSESAVGPSAESFRVVCFGGPSLGAQQCAKALLDNDNPTVTAAG